MKYNPSDSLVLLLLTRADNYTYAKRHIPADRDRDSSGPRRGSAGGAALLLWRNMETQRRQDKTPAAAGGSVHEICFAGFRV